MYISDVLKKSGRNLKQAKARTLLTALAIGVGSFALSLTLAASNGAQSFVNKIIADNFDPAELIVANDEQVLGRGDNSKPKEYNGSFGTFASNAGTPIQVKQLTDEDIQKIRNISGVEEVREAIPLNLEYITRSGQKKYIANAIDFSPSQNPETLAGSITKPLPAKSVLLPEAYVAALGFSSPEDAVGKKIVVAMQKPVDQKALQSAAQAGTLPTTQDGLDKVAKNNTKEYQYTVAAVLKKPTSSQPGTELYLFLSNKDAKELNDFATENTNQFHKYTYGYVRVKGGNDKQKLIAVQDKLKQSGYISQSVEETQKFLTQIIGVLQGIVVAFGAIAVIASVFGVVNTMYISVLQRTREIGLMKALGMRRRDIGRLFRFEAAWIGFIGGVTGAIAAYITTLALNPWITKQLELGKQELLIYNFKEVAILIVILTVVAIVAGWIPSRKAAKLDPIEALRTE